MSDAVDDELAMVLVREVQGLGETAANPIDVGANERQTLGKSGLCGGSLQPGFEAFVVGLALWVFEDLGLEEYVVGVGCLVEELRALRMEFEGILEEPQGILNLQDTSISDPNKPTNSRAQHTWRSFVVSISSSRLSSGSTLMAEKAACGRDGLAKKASSKGSIAYHIVAGCDSII